MIWFIFIHSTILLCLCVYYMSCGPTRISSHSLRNLLPEKLKKNYSRFMVKNHLSYIVVVWQYVAKCCRGLPSSIIWENTVNWSYETGRGKIGRSINSSSDKLVTWMWSLGKFVIEKKKQKYSYFLTYMWWRLLARDLF